MTTMRLAMAFVGLLVWPGSGHGSTPTREISQDPVNILMVGDTYFGESYRNAIEQISREHVLKAKGYEHSLAQFSQLLRAADLVIANLETPLTDLARSPLEGRKQYIHRGDPNKTAETLKNHNLRVVSLANNHSMDYGASGLDQTLQSLKRHDFQWLGAGRNEASSKLPLQFDFRPGARLARVIVTACFEYKESYDTMGFYSNGSKGGVNACTRGGIFSQVEALRRINPDAFIVAYPHFLKNYVRETEEQKSVSRAYIDAGANLVVGHGAHLFQSIEKYRDGWIVYSLGNFVFNAPGRYRQHRAPPFSLIAQLGIGDQKSGLRYQLKLYPILSDNALTNYQPDFIRGPLFERVKNDLLLPGIHPPGQAHAAVTGEDRHGSYIAIDVTPGRSM